MKRSIRRLGERAFSAPALRSLWMRLVLLSLILAIVPFIIYRQLQSADAEQRSLLRRAVSEQGELIAAGLEPSLDPARIPDMPAVLSRFEGGDSDIRILFRPSGGDTETYFVGAWPPVGADDLAEEQKRLLATGVLSRLGTGCTMPSGDGSDTYETVYETVNGSRRVIASVTPVHRDSGCWIVITTKEHLGRSGPGGEIPYWQTPEMLVSAAVYLAMVAVIFGIFYSVRANLARFAELARLTGIGGGRNSSFRSRNALPELDAVAGSFDEMVGNLRRSADALRTSAEENAHALKTPIGVIAQALEPIRNALPDDADRAVRSIERIERAIDRLDGLIGAIRRSEEAAAALVSPEREPLDCAELAARVTEGFQPLAREAGLTLSFQAEDRRMTVMGNRDLLTIALENPLENAISLLRPGGRISVAVRRHQRDTVRVTVTDNGPGVAEDRLDFIFLRHVSIRSEEQQDDGHDGLGLWLVRRNVEALGGAAFARRPADGPGLEVVLDLPRA